MLVNSAILALAASVFHRHGHPEVAEIRDAHRLLSPLLGSRAAGVAFAVALLAAGQSAALTGTLAGQAVMNGFVRVRLPTVGAPALHPQPRPRPGAGRRALRGRAGRRRAARRLPGGPEPGSCPSPWCWSLLWLTADPAADGRAGEPPLDDLAFGWASAALILGLNVYLLAAMARG